MQEISLEKIAEVALENSGLGFFHLVLATGEMNYSPNYSVILTGFEKTGFSNNDFLKYLHVDDQPVRDAAYKAAAETGKLKYEARSVWDDGSIHWMLVRGTFLTDENGNRVILTGTLDDVTTQYEHRDELAARELLISAGEAKFRSIIDHAPFPTALYVGRELIIETANPEMIRLWGKDDRVLNLSLHEALPELVGQDLFEILDEVYLTGKAYHAQEALVKLVVDEQLQSFYFTFTYKPLLDDNRNVYAIINMAIDVTEQVLHRQEIEIAEYNLRTAVELAQLGTFSIELATTEINYSERTRDWFGISYNEVIDTERAYRAVIESDRPRVKDFFQRLASSANGEVIDIEFTIRPGYGFKDRVIHSQGRCFYDEQGKPVRITGASQDVTTERKIQMALEQKVQERTEELQLVNEELTATNEELFDSNQRLTYSNEELAQYAYVASHDLQEPLRKIRMFSDMLNKKTDLHAENKDLVGKINRSAERMSLLIENLLEFSRLLKSDRLMNAVDLNMVVNDVKSDFELVIEETGATINIENLEVIEAIGLQMNQLFYNLISNGLKFTRPDVKPVINISGVKLSEEEARLRVVGPLHHTDYYHIQVSDNGIGIEDQYADQIFEVFKRLHRREIYPGSGIGLALCRRIVTNHNGYIYTESTVQKGTTFHILLPLQNSGSNDIII